MSEYSKGKCMTTCPNMKNASDTIREYQLIEFALNAKITELTSCLSEAVDLMEDVITGDYKPDSFTTQPWRAALKQEGE